MEEKTGICELLWGTESTHWLEERKSPKEEENSILNKSEYGISWRHIGREKNALNC